MGRHDMANWFNPFELSYFGWKLWWGIAIGILVVLVMFLPLEFRVVDEVGRPVSGAVIELSADSNPAATAVTREGKASLFVLWPGRYDVRVTSAGYRPFEWTVDTTRIDLHFSGVQIMLHH